MLFVGFCESVSIDLVESFSFDAIQPKNMVADGLLAVITFRGIYECIRVSMGLLPSANFFQKRMRVHV